MNFPIRIVTPELDEADHITAALEGAIARWEATHGKPFRDPEPEEIAEARARADEAVMGLVWNLLAREGREAMEIER